MVNMGRYDRFIRTVLGVAMLLAANYLTVPQWGTVTLIVVGAVLLLTALVGFCPIYALFGTGTTGRPRTSR